MSEFSVFNLPQGAIQYLYSMRETIWLNPPYQRMSEIWPKDKRQLLVDSVINGYDIPKLYFHELVPAKKIGKVIQKYALIDGKQRLEALWGFMEGRFALADDFEYLHDDSVKAAGLTYQALGAKYPAIKARFDATSLDIVAVRTEDIELIEEMFSRLNEAVPLNAPEKRNAFGGPLPPAIRELSAHSFFSSKLPFADHRYRHRDLACKFLMIESKDGITDTKKAYLDAFVRKWAATGKTKANARRLREAVECHLQNMAAVFEDADSLLRSIGMTLLLFHFFRLLDKTGLKGEIRRDHFLEFERAREQNRVDAEKDMAQANYDLLEFDKHNQTPNDAYAVQIRMGILVRFMRKHFHVRLPTGHKYILRRP